MHAGSARDWPVGLALLLAWLLAVVAHLFFGDYDANIALRGWSPLDFTHSVLFPENFSRDYPGGSWSMGNSILPWIYPGLVSLGFPIEPLLFAMTGLEIAILVAGACFLLRTLFPQADWTSVCLVLFLLTLSWATLPNLARIAHPLFNAQFYGFADGLRLFAIALCLRRRFALSAAVLCVVCAIHPLKACFALVFVVGLAWALADIRTDWRRLSAYVGFAVFAGVWFSLWIGGNAPRESVTAAEFFRFSPYLNSHWYPQDLGVLGKNHYRYATPCLAATVVALAVVLRSDWMSPVKKGLVYGYGLLIGVTLFGLAMAWYEVSPFLVKASAQRASLLLMQISVVLVAAQTLRDLSEARWWFFALSVALLVMAFLGRDTWPVLVAVAYVASALWQTRKSTNDVIRIFLTSLLGILVIYQVGLFFTGDQRDVFWLMNVIALIAAVAIFALVSAARAWWPASAAMSGGLRNVLLVGCMFGLGGVWASENRHLDADVVVRGQAYKLAQIWARDHSAENAVFLVDPCDAYGWRDYSNRSSFGSIHEWYKAGWLYSGNRDVLHDGLRRGTALGIEVDALIPAGTRLTPGQARRTLCEAARKTVYSIQGDALGDAVRQFDVDFVVLRKDIAQKYGGYPNWSSKYQNEHYVVLVPPHRQDQ
ncbi:MAG: hypothetical protein AAF493_00220 [Pseudomonadota bacterium]